ncbi:hypothetical protein [Pseudomonas aeruginosa]
MKAETESRIFSVDEYVRPSNGEPIRSVVLFHPVRITVNVR